MNTEKSLEKFSAFAKEQYKTETKVWVYLFLVISVIFAAANLVSAWGYFANGSLSVDWLFSELAMAGGLFLFLYVLRLVSLFTWYFIIFWLLRWFPTIRREKFSANKN